MWYADVISGRRTVPEGMHLHNFHNNLGKARSYDEVYSKLCEINESTNGRLKAMIDCWKDDKQHDPQSFDPRQFPTDGQTGKQDKYKYIVYLWTFHGTLKQWKQHYKKMKKDKNVRESVKRAVLRFIQAAEKKQKGRGEVFYFFYVGETTRGFAVRTNEHMVDVGQHGGSPNLSELSATLRLYNGTGICCTGQVLYAIKSEDVSDNGGIDPECQDRIKFVEAVLATLFGKYCINMARCGWWWEGLASHWRLWNLIGGYSTKGKTGPRVWRSVLWSAVVHDDPFLDDIVDSMGIGANATVEQVWFAMCSYAGKACQAVLKAGTFFLSLCLCCCLCVTDSM